MWGEKNHPPFFRTAPQQVRYALKEMGATVMWGAMTTLGSAIFLFLGQVLLLYKMGVLVTVTSTKNFPRGQSPIEKPFGEAAL